MHPKHLTSYVNAPLVGIEGLCTIQGNANDELEKLKFRVQNSY
jgi:hypothetical protein